MKHTRTRTWLVVAGMAALYAALLDYLERRLPVTPKHTWAEVVGGVILTTVPPAVVRRKVPLSAEEYERLLAGAFVASGIPIILWQLVDHAGDPRRRD